MPNRRKFFRLFPLICLILPAATYGYTDAEIDRMVGELQRENEALKEQISELNGNGEKTNNAPEQTDNGSNSPQGNNESSLSNIASKLGRLQINGFLSAGYSQSSQDINDQNISFSDNGNFSSDSIIGLQTTFRINDTTDVIAQLVAKGEDNWDLNADWAFIRYTPTDELSFRAGRLRLPLYLFSESLEVGFSYPWIRPPGEVYAVPINNYDGVDTTYTFLTGNWVHSLQLFVGNEDDDTFETQVFYGGNITSTLDSWLFRLSAYTFKLKFLDSSLPIDLAGVKNGGDYYTMATLYDDGNWMFIAELSSFKADKPELFRDTDAAYAMIGKRFGKLMPHFTIATAKTTNEPPNPVPIPGVADPSNFSGDSYTLGIRYDLSEYASAKIEWNHYTNLDDTAGIWNGLRYTFPSEAQGVEDIDIFAIVIDAAF